MVFNTLYNNDNYRPNTHNQRQIIYHIIRCGLVHECNIDDTISFTDTTYIGDWDKKFYLPKDIILGLIASIKQ